MVGTLGSRRHQTTWRVGDIGSTAPELARQRYSTVCPRSSDPFYIVSYYIKWVTTSWTNSTILSTCSLVYLSLSFYYLPLVWQVHLHSLQVILPDQEGGQVRESGLNQRYKGSLISSFNPAKCFFLFFFFFMQLSFFDIFMSSMYVF